MTLSRRWVSTGVSSAVPEISKRSRVNRVLAGLRVDDFERNLSSPRSPFPCGERPIGLLALAVLDLRVAGVEREREIEGSEDGVGEVLVGEAGAAGGLHGPPQGRADDRNVASTTDADVVPVGDTFGSTCRRTA